MRATSLFLLALAVPPALHAAEGDTLIGAADCRVVDMFPAPVNRVTWSGPCKDGFAHGNGVMVWEVKHLHYSKIFVSRYEGEVERGLAHGKGKKSFWDGSVYEGEFRNGRFDGKGTMSDTDGRYEGEWKAGMREGQGKMRFHLGGSYEGKWKNNSYYGIGDVTFPGGRKMSGRVPAAAAPEAEEGEVPRPHYWLRFGERPRVDEKAAKLNYGLEYGRPLVGEEEKTETVKGSNIPYDKSYSQLTHEEKELVRSSYPLFDASDEPPYPARGTKELYEKVSREQNVRYATGDILIFVTVGADGNAIAANVVKTPKESLSNDIRTLLLAEKYKPGTCQDKPCTMVYPFHMKFRVQR